MAKSDLESVMWRLCRNESCNKQMLWGGYQMSILEQTKTIEQIKQELGPVKASQILRMSKLEQYYGGLTDGKGKFCAIGAIRVYFGWSGKTWHRDAFWNPVYEQDKLIPRNISNDIVRWNDKEHLSFEQIADKLEEMGY